MSLGRAEDHCCVWPGCVSLVDAEHMLCRAHWVQCPERIRAALTFAWREQNRAVLDSAQAELRRFVGDQGAGTGDLFGPMPQGP